MQRFLTWFNRNNRRSMPQSFRNFDGRKSTMLVLTTAAVGAAAFGLLRRRGAGSLFRRMIQPLAGRNAS